jgi:hypothetical protein
LLKDGSKNILESGKMTLARGLGILLLQSLFAVFKVNALNLMFNPFIFGTVLSIARQIKLNKNSFSDFHSLMGDSFYTFNCQKILVI